MTAKEALKILSGDFSDVTLMDGDLHTDVYAEAFKMAYEALEKADKYRWHDLRKNPNDLPKDAEYVLVCWRGIKNNWYDAMLWYADRKAFSLYGDHPVMSDERSVKFGDVIAWKYIEPFEVTEES